MTLARDLMAAVWDRKPHPEDGDMPATRPPDAPGAHGDRNLRTVSQSPDAAASTAIPSPPHPEAPPLDVGSRWHADEAHRLAKLAELTKDRSPWAAARDMEWSTT